MKYVYEEFIKFQGDFLKEKTDFYGENSPLDKESFKDFLREYLAYGKRRYGEGFLREKAVLSTEISANIREGEYLSVLEFLAFKRPKKRLYENWDLYTDRASVDGNTICLKDGYTFPVPAAKYEFKNGVARLSFAVKIGSDYKAYTNRLYDTTTGRQVELRFGCADCIRLFFAPNGTFAYKNGSVDRYHPKIESICRYVFDEWLSVELEIGENEFFVRVKGQEYKFAYSFDKLPDTLYLGGGMQPTEEWSVKILDGEDLNGEKIQFFKELENDDRTEISLGKVRLPFVLGTQENKDQELVLRSEFFANKEKRSVLKIYSLDPGGEVLINGVSVFRKDDFQAATIDVTPWCREGRNELEIVVFPRAPEILYNWHRHEDYYNGWFCLGVTVVQTKLFVSSEPIIKTLKIGEETTFSVRWDTGLRNREVSYVVYLNKSYPERGEQKEIGRGKIFDAVMEETFCLPVEIWDFHSPNLYEIEVKLYENGEEAASSKQETGFRTIEQKLGGVFLNGKQISLNGALNMQFLPPYNQIPLTHVCPSSKQIVEQMLALKNMNGNCLRMHQLGYGSNDKRFAQIADRLGVLLIWTTRLIDSVENMQWTKEWKQKEGYLAQIRQVINHPSIIMFEGSNELHTGINEIDRIYREFVLAVKSVDDSRLLSPVSHLYYGGGIYENGTYYNDDGTSLEDGSPACAPIEWMDENVVRSAHTYCLLLGYGASWQDMLSQNWQWQDELFNAKERAYIVSEFAVIGRQNPFVDEAKDYFNGASYELPDEVAALGFSFEEAEWEISQAFQALCASVTVKKLKSCGVDGMLWCSLWGGANNGSYLKPIVDFYGYKKFAYYALREGFAEVGAFHNEPQLLWSKEHKVSPMLCTFKEGAFDVTVECFTTDGVAVFERKYYDVKGGENVSLSSFEPKFPKDGYYVLRYTVEEK